MVRSTSIGTASWLRRSMVFVTAAAIAIVGTVVAVEGLASAGPERASSVLPIGQVVGSITGGAAHTCGVQTSRAVLCWGKNDVGQATAPAGTFVDVSAGNSFTCGIKTDATIACWGKNDVGQATAPV